MQRSLETTNGIATVANLDTVWVTGDLFEHDLRNEVHLHDLVEVLFSAYPNETFHGTVSNIGDSLDPSTHAVKVRVVLANPGHRLKPAMFAAVRIAQPSAGRILVPLAAVLHDGEVTEVYVPVGPGKYALRQVKTGATKGGAIEICKAVSTMETVWSPKALRSCVRRLEIDMIALLKTLLRYRTIVLIVLVVALAAGIFGALKLDVEAYPDPSPPLVEIITQNPCMVSRGDGATGDRAN